MQKEMATHSSILAWEIPWREEPGRTQSMGSQIIKHNLATKKQQQHGSYSIVCLKNEKIVDLKSSHHKEEKKNGKNEEFLWIGSGNGYCLEASHITSMQSGLRTTALAKAI